MATFLDLLMLLSVAHNVLLLLTLLCLECALSIDNVLMIALTVQRLPESQRERVRILALSFALITRLGLAFLGLWLLKLNTPVHELLPVILPGALQAITFKDLTLLLGGLFLIYNAVTQLHTFVELNDKTSSHTPENAPSWLYTVCTLVIMDVVFSIDSVLSALALTQVYWLLVTTIVGSFAIVLLFSKALFVILEQHPSLKILALAFLITIGVTLFLEGLHHSIPKDKTYLPLAFAGLIEILRIRKTHTQKNA